MKLELSNLTKRYGPLVALDDFSITIETTEKDPFSGLIRHIPWGYLY